MSDKTDHDAAEKLAAVIDDGGNAFGAGVVNLARCYRSDRERIAALESALGVLDENADLRAQLARAEAERSWLDAFTDDRDHDSCDHGDCEACMAELIRLRFGFDTEGPTNAE